MPITTIPITAVFAFQFAGCAYHPPDGDHTCFGYLLSLVVVFYDDVDQKEEGMSNHGIFPPEECEIAAPFDWTALIEGSPSMPLILLRSRI